MGILFGLEPLVEKIKTIVILYNKPQMEVILLQVKHHLLDLLNMTEGQPVEVFL